MKKQRHIYSYAPSSGVEHHTVIERRSDSIVMLSREDSFFAMSFPKSELDAGLHYYTTRVRAIEAFIEKAKAALADATRAAGHDGWREALRDARKRLEAVPGKEIAVNCQKQAPNASGE